MPPPAERSPMLHDLFRDAIEEAVGVDDLGHQSYDATESGSTFKATAKLGEFLGARFSGFPIVLAWRAV